MSVEIYRNSDFLTLFAGEPCRPIASGPDVDGIRARPNTFINAYSDAFLVVHHGVPCR